MNGFLSTSGNQIVDSAGTPFQIRGVNWSGFETPRYSPDGLHLRNYRDVVDQMAGLGFNTLRIPFSNSLLEPGRMPSQGSIDTWNANQELAGLTSLQILDLIIEYAGSVGMRVILDHHRSNAGYSAQENGLWYTNDYPETRWIDDWVMLAQRYKNNPTVIGADLHNEPFSGTWGDGKPTDWAAAAERAGSAIQAVNSDWLIFVEGIQTYQGHHYWWGGNLMGVRDRPVDLPVDNKLVYSAHDYPNSVHPQPWFNEGNYPNNLPALFRQFWGFIYEENIAPVYIGEMGSRLQDSRDIQWFEKLRAYLSGDFDANGVVDIPSDDLGISWSWWALNPNSGDTGGILNPDWTTVDRGKFQWIHPLLPGGVMPEPKPVGTPGDDVLNGTPFPDVFNGLGGDDTLTGGGGNDTLDGGTGSDVLIGGAGDDVYYIDNPLDRVQEKSFEGYDKVRTTVSYQLGSGEIEHLETADPAGTAPLWLTGNEIPNTIIGNEGDNVLDGRGGADILIGRGGNDRYRLDSPLDQVFELPGGGFDTIEVSFTFSLADLPSVEGLSASDPGSTDRLNLTGNDAPNLLIGNAGDNILGGGGGADVLVGGAGDDVYYVDNPLDQVQEKTFQGYDKVRTTVSYQLGSGEIEHLETADPAGTAPLWLTGNEISNTIIGNEGGNVLDGGGGADTLQGLQGDDIYIVENPGDLVIEAGGQGRDQVLTSVSYALQRSASIEGLSASTLASTAPLVLKGSDAGNTIRGNNGANKLIGLGGNDVIAGNGGNDLISGGAGQDRLTGGKGRDSFLFDKAPKSKNADVIVDFSPVHDTIRIDNADFRKVGRNGRPAEDALVFGSAAADASDRLIYDQTSGVLYYDPDGTGAAAQVRMATLANKAALTLSDFLIV